MIKIAAVLFGIVFARRDTWVRPGRHEQRDAFRYLPRQRRAQFRPCRIRDRIPPLRHGWCGRHGCSSKYLVSFTRSWQCSGS